MSEQNSFILEIHYGTEISALSVDTRNVCSNALISLINEISKSLNCENSFEMMFLPSEKGSYKDIIKILKNKKTSYKINNTTKIISFIILLMGTPQIIQNFRLTSREIEQKDFEIETQRTDKCLTWLEQLNALKQQGIKVEISQEELRRICNNVRVFKNINRFYNKIDKNNDILDQEFLLKTEGGKELKKIIIKKEDFKKFIYTDDDVYSGKFEGIHFEIISPVIKSVKGAKSWTGEYKGISLSDEGIPLIENGEIVHFYMSDDNFKKEINNQEISFKQGDIIVGNIRINGKIREDFSISHRKIWIESVEKYNNEEREAFKKKIAYDLLEELPLFSGKSK